MVMTLLFLEQKMGKSVMCKALLYFFINVLLYQNPVNTL